MLEHFGEDPEWKELLVRQRKERLELLRPTLAAVQAKYNAERKRITQEIEREEEKHHNATRELREAVTSIDTFLTMDGTHPEFNPARQRVNDSLAKQAQRRDQYVDYMSKHFTLSLAQKVIAHELLPVTTIPGKACPHNPYVAIVLYPIAESHANRFILRHVKKGLQSVHARLQHDLSQAVTQHAESLMPLKAAFEESNAAEAKERLTLRQSAARRHVDDLVVLCEELKERNHTPLEVQLYWSLSHPHATESWANLLRSQYEPDEIMDGIGALLATGTVDSSVAVRFGLIIRSHASATRPIATENSTTAVVTAAEPKQDYSDARMNMLIATLGAEVAQSVAEEDKRYQHLEWGHYVSYLGTLRTNLRRAELLGLAETVVAYPELLTQQGALDDWLAQSGDKCDEIDRRLARASYNPKAVHALLKAFKPETKRYIGGNVIPEHAVRRNAQPNLKGTGADFVEMLETMVKSGVILEKASTYSLNPVVEEVADLALREALTYYLNASRASQS